jgi:hypothetical protein
VPRVWQLDNARPTNGIVEKELSHDKPRVICKKSLGHETTCTVTERSNQFGVVVDLFRNDKTLEWQSEIENLFPGVVLQGAGRIYGDVVSTEERLFFIGRLGVLRFIMVMRLTDGKLIDHFAFEENSIENLAVISKYNQK